MNYPNTLRNITEYGNEYKYLLDNSTKLADERPRDSNKYAQDGSGTKKPYFVRILGVFKWY